MAKTGSKILRRQILLMRLYVIVLMLLMVLSLMALLSQKVFARTYVITDGERVITYTTFADDPQQILEQAGVTLGEDDTFTTEAVEGAAAITVCRARNIIVQYHGQTREVTSFGETAGELLARLDLEVTGEDLVSHGLEEEIYDGMVLKIDRVKTLRETFTTTIVHEVSRCSDRALPQGTEAVLTEGVDGELLRIADITYINGEEATRRIFFEKVTRAPTGQVVAVGTGPVRKKAAAPVIRDGYITLPTGEVLTYTHTATVRATAYTHSDEGCDRTTATGTTVHWGTVAVDPRYIPYGTRMFIMSADGTYVYGIATAEDCGGDIKGDRMDLYMPTHEQCMEFGRRPCTLYFLG